MLREFNLICKVLFLNLKIVKNPSSIINNCPIDKGSVNQLSNVADGEAISLKGSAERSLIM